MVRKPLRSRGPRSIWLAAAAAALALGACGEPPRPMPYAGGDPEAGREIIASVGCGVCHTIPGIRGARGRVGPPLTGFARRSYIAGIAPNEPQMLTRFVLDPPSVAPPTAMPNLGLTPVQARHVVAYLYTLR